MSQGKRSRILLTGFGPFPGVPINATGLLIERLRERAAAAFPDHDVERAILPTEWAQVEALSRLYADPAPRLALHFGVSPTARGFEIEAHAVNRAARLPDACGALPIARHLLTDGPGRRDSRLPVEAILSRLKAAGLPAMLSRDAGDYLCNAAFYQCVGHGERTGALSGFIHVPTSLVGGGADGLAPLPGCPLGWEGAMEGGLVIIGACLECG